MMWLLLLLCIWRMQAHAVSPEQILKTAWEDKTYLVHEEIQSTDSKNPLRTVDGVISYEDNTYIEAEVGLKLNLKSWPEWKAGTSSRSVQNLLKQSSLAWALKTRYSTLLLYELNRRKMETVDGLSKLSEKYLNALGMALRTGRISAKTFLGAKTDAYKTNQIYLTLVQERDALEKTIKGWVPEWKQGPLSPINLISIEDISNVVAINPSFSESLTKKIAKQEISQIEQELEIVRGREKQWIKSIEVTRAEKNNEERYKLELTIQIPFLGSDDYAKQKQNDLFLKKALKKKELDETGDQLQTLKVQILNLTDLYKSAQKISGYKIQTLDPLTNTERQIAELQEKLDMLNQQQQITTLYLDYLLESETLINNPGKNYLDREQKAIL